jgi:hypothetical protein
MRKRKGVRRKRVIRRQTRLRVTVDLADRIDLFVRKAFSEEVSKAMDARLSGLSSVIVSSMNQTATMIENCNRVLLWAEAALREAANNRKVLKALVKD